MSKFKHRIPKSIKIGLHIRPLSLQKELKNDKGETLWGQRNGPDGKILLSETNPSDLQLLETLTHEIFHDLFTHFDLHQMEGMSDGREEHLVEVMSKGILMVLKDNPKYLKYLTEVIQNG